MHARYNHALNRTHARRPSRGRTMQANDRATTTLKPNRAAWWSHSVARQCVHTVGDHGWAVRPKGRLPQAGQCGLMATFLGLVMQPDRRTPEPGACRFDFFPSAKGTSFRLWFNKPLCKPLKQSNLSLCITLVVAWWLIDSCNFRKMIDYYNVHRVKKLQEGNTNCQGYYDNMTSLFSSIKTKVKSFLTSSPSFF